MEKVQDLSRVSVIIPTYNRAAVIGRTIDSVLAQTYPNIEVIVVDDGSTDDTRDVLSRYDERVRYVYQQNSGPSAARNRGVAQSTADYIAFLDSDDIILPTKVAKQVAYLDAHPEADIVLCGWRAFERDGVTIGLEVKSVSIGHLLDDTLLSGINGLIPLNAPLMRRECFVCLHGFDGSLVSREEQDLWIRAILAGYKFGIVSEVLCTIADTPASYGKNLANTEKVMPLILERVFSHPALRKRTLALKDQVHARVYLQLGYCHFSNRLTEGDSEMDLARDYLDKAMALKLRARAWGQANLDLVPYWAMTLAGDANPKANLFRLMDELFPKPLRPAWMEAEFSARLHTMLAFRAYRANRRWEVVHHVCNAVRFKPTLVNNRGISAIFIRSLLDRFS